MTRGFNSVRYLNGTTLELTPWASRVLTPTQMDEIANRMVPKGATVEIGKARGWTVRLLVDGLVVGESFEQATPMEAVRVAASRLCPICRRRPGEVPANLDGRITAVCDACWERHEDERVAHG